MRRIMIGLLVLCGLLGVLGAEPARAADNVASDNVAGEIVYLIDFVRKSDCTFIRNGSDYAGPAAADHIQSKYDYYKADIRTAEDFIDRAATKSMMSGRPYQVRCPTAAVVPAADWLRAELERYRVHELAGGTGGN